VRTSKSPRELYSLAKRYGCWDPESIPVSEDRPHWASLDPAEREQFIKVCALFYVGEASVSETLPWFFLSVLDPDRRMFLASQIYDEVKHAEFFNRYFEQAFNAANPAAYITPTYRRILVDDLKLRGEELGRALCNQDQDRVGLASVLFAAKYFGIIEGVLAVTGYDALEDLAAKTSCFPRLLEGIRLIRADEGRHIAHGMGFIRETICNNPEYVAPVRQLFVHEAAEVPLLNASASHPNGLPPDLHRLSALADQHYRKRLRDAGLNMMVLRPCLKNNRLLKADEVTKDDIDD